MSSSFQQRRRAVALLALLAMPACASAVHVSSEGVVDLEGRPVDPFAGDAAPTVLVFTRSDCPISNRYAPEINRIADLYSARGARFWIVYPDDDDTSAAIREHRERFGYKSPAVRDPLHTLVQAAAAKVTPEVAVFDADQRLAYAGRIDDQYVAFGKRRAQPTQRDLEDALRAVLAGERPPTARTRAVGCYIPPLR